MGSQPTDCNVVVTKIKAFALTGRRLTPITTQGDALG